MNVVLTYFHRLILSNRVIFHRGLTQTISQEFVSFPLWVLQSSFSPQLLLLFLMTFKPGDRSLHVLVTET